MRSPTTTTSLPRGLRGSGSPTTCSRARRRSTTSASRRTCSARCTSTARSSSATMLVSFSPATGHTLPDRYIEGTCPICGYPEARGDQCDNCGNQLDPTDLIDPRSRIDGSTPEFRETKHLFLDLPAFADRLRAWIRRTTTGGRTSATSRSRSSTRSGRARSRATSTGASRPGARVRGGRQADLRLVRRGDRLPLGSIEWAQNRRPGRLARVVAEPRGRGTTTSRARTTSSSTR